MVSSASQVMRLIDIAKTANDYEYPMTSKEIVSKHGTETIEYANGSENLGDVLDRSQVETFECADDVCLTVYSTASKEAVGRRFYSDRDPTTPGEHGPTQVSF